MDAYNTTLRKCFGFKTATEVFMEKLKPLHLNRSFTVPLNRVTT